MNGATQASSVAPFMGNKQLLITIRKREHVANFCCRQYLVSILETQTVGPCAPVLLPLRGRGSIHFSCLARINPAGDRGLPCTTARPRGAPPGASFLQHSASHRGSFRSLTALPGYAVRLLWP